MDGSRDEPPYLYFVVDWGECGWTYLFNVVLLLAQAMTRHQLGAVLIGLVCGLSLGAVVTLYLTELYNAPPIAKFAAMECYQHKDEFEPWHTVADGQILIVGNRHYLAVTREQRNSNDRYFGFKTYGFEISIVEADKTWKKTQCPQVWLR